MEIAAFGPVAASNREAIARIPRLSKYGRYFAADNISAIERLDQFVAPLVERGLERDALILAPYVLPIRLAVWWGCICVRHSFPSSEQLALGTVVRWVQAPNQEQRTYLLAAERLQSTSSAGGLLIRSALFAGVGAEGRLTFDDCEPAMSARWLLGAVYASLVQGPPNGIAASHGQFLSFAIDVAAGKAVWK